MSDQSEDIDDLEDILDETEDILSTIDIGSLIEAIEWENLPDVIEVEDIPEALEESDASEAVKLRELIELSSLPDLWGDNDFRQLWREKMEFDDELDDITDDDQDEDDEWVDAEMPSGDVHDVDPESIENAIQSKMSDSVGQFREKLLDTHDRLKQIREKNENRFPDRRRNRSRNPTAASTMTRSKSTVAGGLKYSAVPEETKYSTAPNRSRIYGNRFENARGDADE